MTSVTWTPRGINADAGSIPAITGAASYRGWYLTNWTQGALTGTDSAFADGDPSTFATLVTSSYYDAQFVTMRFATTQAVPSSPPIGLHFHAEIENVGDGSSATFDLVYGATFGDGDEPTSAWMGYGYYVAPNTFGFDVALTDPTDQATWAANMADPGFFLAVISATHYAASVLTIHVREMSIVMDYAEVAPLRQVQRNDGLGRSVVRARGGTSVQKSIRQRGYR